MHEIRLEGVAFIQAAMADLVAGRTTCVIAHRLSTVRRADLILLMDGGRVAELGTHEQLVKARGAYYGMVLRQMESAGRDGIGAGSQATDVTTAAGRGGAKFLAKT